MDWIKKRENQIFFSVTLVTIIIAICPMLSKYCLLGHDTEYHLLRIETLKQQIEMGKPFLKVNPTFFGGAGYASSMFYPDLLLYIPALLRVVGFSIKSSYHIFMILCVVLCYAVSYVCAKKMTGNRYIGILFAIIITFSSYHLDDIVVRAAVGEYTAFIFIPVVVYGVYNLCFEDMNKPWILGIGMALVMLCHTLSFAMCILMVVLMMIFNFDVFIKKPKLIIKLFITALITILITIPYWAPILEQFLSTKFYVSQPWIEPAQEAVKVASIFSYTFPTLGIGLMILLLPRVLIFRNEDDSILKYADQCIALGIIFAVMASEVMPWNVLGKYFSMVQFPWRMYVISSVLLSIGAAVSLYRLAGAICIGASDTPKEYDNEHIVINNDSLINKYGMVLALVLAIMSVTTMYTYSNQTREYYDFSNDYYSYKPYTANVIAGEWLPLSVTDKDSIVEQSEHAVASDGSEIEFSREKGVLKFKTDGSFKYVDVPLIYYKGYSATCGDTKLILDGNGNNGFVRVYTYGITDEVSVYYEGTIFQKVMNIFGLMVALGTIAFVLTFKSIKRELYGM